MNQHTLVRMPRSVRTGAAIGAILGTIGIGAGTFVLSFTALTDLVRTYSLAGDLAWIWAVSLDGLIVVATMALVVLAGERARRDRRRPSRTRQVRGADVNPDRAERRQRLTERLHDGGGQVLDCITDDSLDAFAGVAEWVDEVQTAASVRHYALQVMYPARSGIMATSIGALASVTSSFQSPSSHTSG